jgi:hypothetical protein
MLPLLWDIIERKDAFLCTPYWEKEGEIVNLAAAKYSDLRAGREPPCRSLTKKSRSTCVIALSLSLSLSL